MKDESKDVWLRESDKEKYYKELPLKQKQIRDYYAKRAKEKKLK